MAVTVLAAALALIIIPSVLAFPAQNSPVSIKVMWTFLQVTGPAVLGVACLYAVGRARLEWNAWHASQFDVAEFVDRRSDTGPGTMASVELTARFERKLTESRIYRTAAVPDTGRINDFIQIVENAADAAPQGWWKAVSRLMRLVRPPSAFRVSATLLDGSTPGEHKIVVELIRLPRFLAAPLIISDVDEDRLVEQAANSVAALMFPVTRHCKHPQWVAWRNCAMPTELFDAYQRAHQFQLARRYDEALHEFYRALSHDPGNVYIRLETAQLLERLELFLEALAIYDDVIVICNREDERLARWWNSTEFALEKGRRLRSRGGALLLARYRHALLMGLGDRIAGQWWLPDWECPHEDHWDPRRGQRSAVRAMLAHRFDRYDDIPDTAWLPPGEKRLTLGKILSDELPAGLHAADRQERAALLRHYLCTVAQYEFERLVEDTTRRGSVYRTREMRELLSPASVRLGLVWTTLRRTMSQAALPGAEEQSSTVYRNVTLNPGLRKLFGSDSWPPEPSRLQEVIEALLPKKAGWHEHYSATCIFAVALLSAAADTARPDADQERTLARLAILQLHKAAAASHSGYLAERRRWLMYEDPDLASLRGTDAFRNFETLVFAPERPASLRPAGSTSLELVFYQAKLVAALGELMAGVWRAHGAELTAEADPSRLRGWHAREEQAWRQVTLLAVGHRDWHIRRRVIKELRRWWDESGRNEDHLLPTEYSEEALYVRHARLLGPEEEGNKTVIRGARKIGDINDTAKRYLDRCEHRMRELAAELHRLSDDRDPADDCRNASSAVAQMSLTPLLHLPGRSLKDQARFCQARAELWERLSTWFDDEGADEPAAVRAAEFRKRLRPPTPSWAALSGRGRSPGADGRS
jgi:hypothetical protein